MNFDPEQRPENIDSAPDAGGPCGFFTFAYQLAGIFALIFAGAFVLAALIHWHVYHRISGLSDLAWVWRDFSGGIVLSTIFFGLVVHYGWMAMAKCSQPIPPAMRWHRRMWTFIFRSLVAVAAVGMAITAVSGMAAGMVEPALVALVNLVILLLAVYSLPSPGFRGLGHTSEWAWAFFLVFIFCGGLPSLVFVGVGSLLFPLIPLYRRQLWLWFPKRLPDLDKIAPTPPSYGRPPVSHSGQRGITLIELLIVVALLSIFMVAVAQLAEATHHQVRRHAAVSGAAVAANDQFALLRAHREEIAPGEHPMAEGEGVCRITAGPGGRLWRVDVAIPIVDDAVATTFTAATLIAAPEDGQ